MKYICLGYIEPGKFEGMTEDERHATFDECFEYNDHLRANGHLVAEVLMSQHPGMKYGLLEIRPVADLNELMRESERRRRKDTSL